MAKGKNKNKWKERKTFYYVTQIGIQIITMQMIRERVSFACYWPITRYNCICDGIIMYQNQNLQRVVSANQVNELNWDFEAR